MLGSATHYPFVSSFTAAWTCEALRRVGRADGRRPTDARVRGRVGVGSYVVVSHPLDGDRVDECDRGDRGRHPYPRQVFHLEHLSNEVEVVPTPGHRRPLGGFVDVCGEVRGRGDQVIGVESAPGASRVRGHEIRAEDGAAPGAGHGDRVAKRVHHLPLRPLGFKGSSPQRGLHPGAARYPAPSPETPCRAGSGICTRGPSSR